MFSTGKISSYVSFPLEDLEMRPYLHISDAAKEKSKRATGECVTDDWDVGVRWVVRKDKMVVAGFAPGCLAHPSHAKPCACAAKKPTWASTL